MKRKVLSSHADLGHYLLGIEYDISNIIKQSTNGAVDFSVCVVYIGLRLKLLRVSGIHEKGDSLHMIISCRVGKAVTQTFLQTAYWKAGSSISKCSFKTLSN